MSKEWSLKITRGEAELLADRYIPQVWGSLRTAWVNGFIDYPERGVAKYEKTSAAYKYRLLGKADRQRFNGTAWWKRPRPATNNGV